MTKDSAGACFTGSPWFADDAADGAAGDGDGVLRCTAAPLRNRPQVRTKMASAGLLLNIKGEAAQQLGIEIGGLLRQHLAAKGNTADLLDSCRVHQKSDVSSLAHPGDGFEGIALVFHVILIADCLFRDSENPLQQELVQLNNVEFALV